MTIGEFMKRCTNNPCFVLVTVKKGKREVFCDMGDSEQIDKVNKMEFKSVSFSGGGVDPTFTI